MIMTPQSSSQTDGSARLAFLKHLDDLAFFLEVDGANPFRIRAYHKALEVLEGLSDTEFDHRLANKTLTELNGIGKGIAGLAEEWGSQQSTADLSQLQEKYSAQLVELRSIAGLGSKKIRQLHDELGISSQGELEYACQENRLVTLKGFGEKTQAKVLHAIQQQKAQKGLRLLGDLWPQWEAFHQKNQKKFQKAEISLTPAGDLGAKEPIIRDLQFLVGLSPHVKFPDALEVLGAQILQAETKTQVRALLAPFGEVTLLSSSVEKSEMKADLEESDLQGVFHFHTTASDGKQSLEEMAEAAARKGWAYAGVSDHSQTAFYASGLKKEDLASQAAQIKKWNQSGHTLHLFHGVESDILKDGSLDYPPSVLKQLDFVIASIHSRYGMKDMTERLVKAIENPATTMIGHLSGRLLLAREPYDFDQKKVFEAAIKHRCVIELNSHPQRLDADWKVLSDYSEKGLLISINPDAHSIDGFEDVRYGIWMAAKAKFPRENIINTWPLEKITKFLKERK
jgi:DNA polymerase (family 10)